MVTRLETIHFITIDCSSCLNQYGLNHTKYTAAVRPMISFMFGANIAYPLIKK